MNLKDLAQAYTAFDGAVTFWMIPYETLQVTIQLQELNRLEPSAKWVHQESGEERYDDPHEHLLDDPVGEAKRAASPWKRVSLWSTVHNLYAVAEPVTVEIEFADQLPPALRSLQLYWAERNGHVAHNWPLFKQLVSREAAQAWDLAFDNTRDQSWNAPDEIQQEPNANDPEV